MFKSNLLEGQVAVVTGAGRGIGRAIALYLARQGACVALVGLTEKNIMETERLLVAEGLECFYQTADVRNEKDVQSVVDNVIDKKGRIDILVNNAGVTRDGLLMRMKEEDWNFVLDTNLKGAFHFTKSVARPMMKARKGCIVNISSVIGLIGNAGQANYAASKAGLIGYTKSVAKELASRGIRVNALAPGFIQTDMTHELNEEMKENLIKQIPMSIFGTAEDIAKAVFYLCSDFSSYVTGQVLTVDGGMVMS